MGPSPSARLFGARLRLYVELRRVLRAVDGSDVLTVITLAFLGAGVTVVFGVGWALIAAGLVLSLVTPLGAAFRVLVRGR